MDLNFIDQAAQSLFNSLLNTSTEQLSDTKLKAMASTAYHRALILYDARQAFVEEQKSNLEKAKTNEEKEEEKEKKDEKDFDSFFQSLEVRPLPPHPVSKAEDMVPAIAIAAKRGRPRKVL